MRGFIILVLIIWKGWVFAVPLPEKQSAELAAVPLKAVGDPGRIASYADMGLVQTPVKRTQPASELHPDAAPFMNVDKNLLAMAFHAAAGKTGPIESAAGPGTANTATATMGMANGAPSPFSNGGTSITPLTVNADSVNSISENNGLNVNPAPGNPSGDVGSISIGGSTAVNPALGTNPETNIGTGTSNEGSPVYDTNSDGNSNIGPTAGGTSSSVTEGAGNQVTPEGSASTVIGITSNDRGGSTGTTVGGSSTVVGITSGVVGSSSGPGSSNGVKDVGVENSGTGSSDIVTVGTSPTEPISSTPGTGAVTNS